MTEYRLPWLLAAIACALLAFFVLATSLMIATFPYCDEDQTVFTGNFDSKDAAMRSSIRELAIELHKCPEALAYRIIFVAPEDHPWHKGVGRRSLFYDRKSMRLGYEAEAFSAYFGRQYMVDEEAIKTVAENGGTLEDFAQYDKGHR